MAYDVARFNELTKQMSAYASFQRPEHLGRAARRAARRQQLGTLAAQINQRLGFRLDQDAGARLRRARDLLDSVTATARESGQRLYAHAQREQTLAERDERLLAGQHPGSLDGRYRVACTHAERWRLPVPPARWERG